MGRKRQDVTEAELAVLQVLWQQGPCTIRAITEAIYPDGTASDYATVKKLLARLEHKACVERDRSATAHLFNAKISQDELIGRRLQAVADNLCGGSRTPLLMHLLRTERLTAKQRQQLRDHLAALTTGAAKAARGSAHERSARNRGK